MIVYFDYQPEYLYDALHELIRMAYPEALLVRNNQPAEVRVSVRLYGSSSLSVQGIIEEAGRTTAAGEDLAGAAGEIAVSEIKRQARCFTFKLLEKHLGQPVNSYGILTGMRPVKLVHQFIDRNLNDQMIIEQLKTEYLLQEDKAKLLLEVARRQRPYLPEPQNDGKLISVYVGIPYCPGRCTYCSFSGAVLRDYRQEMSPFLDALYKEIITMGAVINEMGLRVQSLYIGGGTPTVLSMEDMGNLFELLHDMYISSSTIEITVEAGRPDTLNPDKLCQLQKLGVDRVCINPQTMNNITLSKIGRNHDLEGVMRSVGWAREAGIKNINMDIIVGLPEETLRENMYTAEKLLLLQPENVTVHTLAIKRGAKMAELGKTNSSAERVREVQQGVDYFSDVYQQAGYIPYYLYRQKYMRASMENIGYSQVGRQCLYNIQMMEERQTIIGLGGGGASKFVDPDGWSLTSFYNPRNPGSYIQTVETLIQRKVDKLKALL